MSAPSIACGFDMLRPNSESATHGIARAAQLLRWIPVSCGRATRLFWLDEIAYLQADTKYTRVVTRDADGLTRRSLNDLESDLDPTRFMRTSRSAIANLEFVDRVVRTHGRIVVELAPVGARLTVTRAHQALWRFV